MIPAHVPLTLAREVKLERSSGAGVEAIAATLGWWLDALASPSACLACVSRRRRGESIPCRVCVVAPAGWFRWRDPAPAVDPAAELAAVVAVVAAPVALYPPSDRPGDARQADAVAGVLPASPDSPAIPAVAASEAGSATQVAERVSEPADGRTAVPPGHDEVEDWEYGAWWPVGSFDGQLVVGG